MSQAGKFIPGGAGRKSGATGSPAPIRGPDRPAGEPPKKSSSRILGKGAGLTRPVAKKQRLPILLMSSVVCCMLVSIAWYEFGVLPARNALEAERLKNEENQKQLAAAAAAAQKEQAAKPAPAFATVSVNSNPAGVATLGGMTKPTPATFDHVAAGAANLVIKADGYDDYRQDVAAAADKPTDLGTIQLIRSTGDVVLTSAQKDVGYTLAGPDGYTHEGQAPDKLSGLPSGNYQLTAHQHDWQLPPIALVIHGRDTVREEIKFPYGTVSIQSDPEGATVRNGKTILGQTPLTLPEMRPGELNVALDLPPYSLERISLIVPEFGTVTKKVTLQTGKDFIAACGMPMVWIPDGFWAGKYEVTQRVFEAVVKFNPSSFRKPNRPVESVSWEEATAFCQKLDQFEQRAGKLPSGYHYALPTESQWDAFSADADINLAATSRVTTLSSTQDVGASEPNKYGLYDTIGNVWEWCLDTADDKGAHSLRGGSWLSSTENFPNVETRSAGVAKYADRFTGFRVVLVPQ